MINEGLYQVVKEICYELIAEFEADSQDVCANSFLSQFSYYFLTHEQPEREKRVLDAALVPAHKAKAEKTVEAAYSDHGGGTFEFYVAHAVQDFLNFILPRIIALPDRDSVFDHYFAQFDKSFYGETCTVTTFAVFSNVGQRAAGRTATGVFLLGVTRRCRRIAVRTGGPETALCRISRLRVQPIPSASAVPFAKNRSFFVFSHSRELPKNKGLIPQPTRCGMRSHGSSCLRCAC